MKKIFILFILLALSLFAFNCGGGSGSSSSPKGENPGEPSIVQLLPAQFIAQTNSIITLHAKVLDGNGAPVKNITVNFTNISPIGALSALSAKTNSIGIASVNIKSTTTGFSTVQAEVNKGVAQVRDRKTVFFSSISTAQPIPKLDLIVDGAGNDYILFEPNVSNDDEVVAIATVFDGFGQRVIGMDVLFGSDSEEATFPLGSTAMTDTSGEASVLVRVIPSALRALPTVMNLTALADNGAFNIVSLTLSPVSIQKVEVFANPLTIDSGETSTITARVTTTAGTPAPDGTTVNFTTDLGSIDPFSQTTDGIAEATFTAVLQPGASDEEAQITAAANGKTSLPVSVTVIAPEPEPVEDTTSPTVTSTNPAAGDCIISGSNPVVAVAITFSENIDCATVTPTTVTITTTVGDWKLTSCSGPNVVFQGTLNAGNTYTVNVGTGVKDLAGNVAVAYVFSFSYNGSCP